MSGFEIPEMGLEKVEKGLDARQPADSNHKRRKPDYSLDDAFEQRRKLLEEERQKRLEKLRGEILGEAR